jgi:hypothetical protein
MCLPCRVNAQGAPAKNTVEQTNSWLCYFGTWRFTNEWSLWTELQLRRANGIAAWQQILPRIGVQYHLNNDVWFTAGYAYVLTYPYGKLPIPLAEPRPEHRPWEQVTLRHKQGTVEFQHRFRLEQRLLQRWTDVDAASGLRLLTDGFTLENRMRYRLWVVIPFTSTPQGAPELFSVVHNEIFVNFGGNVGYNIFDQNRFGITLGYQFSPALNVQVGYMNQYIQKSNGRDAESNHTLTLFVFHNVDFRTP